MSRKLTRLVLAASVAVGVAVTPMLDAYASDRTVEVKDNQFAGHIEDGKPVFDSLPTDTVRWQIVNGEHTITPKNDEPGFAKWPDKVEPSGHRTPDDPVYQVTFAKAGRYFYFCEVHDGMVGVIDVKDQTQATQPPATTPPTQPPTTQPPTTQPPATTTTTSAPASSQGTNKPPSTAGPTPTTTTTAKDKKNKDDKDKKEEETTTTTAPPPPPVDLPDEAIIPVLPGAATGTTSQNGVEAPNGAPEGDAIALLKAKKGGGKAMKLLIVSGLGLGALGFGAAGYKYANRSSKYFPA